MMKKIGFIINPIAGIGGKVGLKGSDGPDIYQKAMDLGAVAESSQKAKLALSRLLPFREEIELITYPGPMGEDVAYACGFKPLIIGKIKAGRSTYLDTQLAAGKMHNLGTDLILFTGGDGTARDVYRGVGIKAVVLGIPAGVKMHSAVFAVNPKNAGEFALSYLTGKVTETRDMEVMDIDESEYRQERLCARLYGYLKIPFQRASVQGLKCSGKNQEKTELDSTAAYFLDTMDSNCYYLIGPGTTTRAIMEKLKLPSTLLGVDVIYQGKLIAKDVNEEQLLRLIKEKTAKIVVSPIGGQGYIFGRGNQQISADIIKKIGRENIIVIATKDKIINLQNKALFADTGDQDTNDILKGYYRVITGYGEEVACKCIA